MTAKWHEKREFLNLRKEWYKKLEEDGFEDIENTAWTTGESYECMNGISQASICSTYSEGKERYYQLAAQYLWVLREEAHNDRRRKKPQEKRWGRVLRVWALHSQGESVRDIAKELDLYRTGVHNIIQKYAPKMLEWHHASYDEAGHWVEEDE